MATKLNKAGWIPVLDLSRMEKNGLDPKRITTDYDNLGPIGELIRKGTE